MVGDGQRYIANGHTTLTTENSRIAALSQADLGAKTDRYSLSGAGHIAAYCGNEFFGLEL